MYIYIYVYYTDVQIGFGVRWYLQAEVLFLGRRSARSLSGPSRGLAFRVLLKDVCKDYVETCLCLGRGGAKEGYVRLQNAGPSPKGPCTQ